MKKLELRKETKPNDDVYFKLLLDGEYVSDSCVYVGVEDEESETYKKQLKKAIEQFETYSKFQCLTKSEILMQSEI